MQYRLSTVQERLDVESLGALTVYGGLASPGVPAIRLRKENGQIRKELFVSMLDRNLQRLSRTLRQLHQNAPGIGKKRSVIRFSLALHGLTGD